MEYKIARGLSVIVLEKDVADMIDKGFVPLGGVDVAWYGGEEMMFFQAMIKRGNGLGMRDRHK